ncbi:MAG: hypothetical protein KJZ72_03780 [Anaerolineales bacterium]|jgi:serine/threonine protein kinase|nr:hypothetical protein [Anaerolineales bacterium]
MHNKNTIMGKKQPWEFEKKIAEGDAGVVYIVCGLHTGEKAILKRPSSYNPLLAHYQVHQIKLEGEILRKINGIKVALEKSNIIVRAVNLIDEASVSVKSSDDCFIVLEHISGFDLDILSRTWEEIETFQHANPFLDDFVYIKNSFNLLLLLSFYGVSQYLKTIHHLGPNQNSGDIGVLWVDLKPKHIFWDFKAQEIILIDWGNSEFLSENMEQNRFSVYSDWWAFIYDFQRFYKLFKLDDFIALDFPNFIGDPETNERVVEEFLSQLEGGIQGLTNEINKISSFEYLDDLFRLFEEFYDFFNDSKFRQVFLKCHENKMPFLHAGIIAALSSEKGIQLSDNYSKYLHEVISSPSEVETLQKLGLYEQILPYILNLYYPDISFSSSEQSWISKSLYQYITDKNFIVNFTTLHDNGMPVKQAAESAAILVDRHYLQSENTIDFILARPDSLHWIIVFHRLGLLKKYIENTDLKNCPSDIQRKAEEAIVFIGQIKQLLDRQDFDEGKVFSTIRECYAEMDFLHAGTLAFILHSKRFTWTELIIRWSQEILKNDSEVRFLKHINLYHDFVVEIQCQYATVSDNKSVDEKIELIHDQFGHALLDENFMSILRDCLSSGLSLWDSVLISAVVTNNTRDLTEDQISSLKDILKSESTLEIIKRLGMLEIFREKLRPLWVYPEPTDKAPNPLLEPDPFQPEGVPNPYPTDVAAATPQPKPIATISLLRSTWEQEGKSEKLRISLISAWNDRKRLEYLSHALIQEGFRGLETKSLYSQMDWLSGISNFHQSADVIVVVLSRQSDSEMWHLLEEIIELASKRNSLTIISRIEDFQPRLRLRNWYQIDLFKPGDYDLLVQQIIQKYKRTDKDPEYAPPPKAAPPPSAPPPIIGRIGRFLTIISFVVALMICSIALLNDSSTSQPVAIPLPPIVLSPFWQGAITLLKGVFVAILFTIIPMWAAKITEYKSRVSQSITEILMFSIVLSIVALFMFKLQGDGTWMFFAIAIAAILDGGGHLLDYLRENQIDQIRREIDGKQKSLKAKMKSSRKAVRLEKEINQYQVMQEYLLRFDQIFQRERILYVSLPSGIFLGVIFGIYKDAKVFEYLEYSILFVSLFAMLILGYFVVELFVRMINPVYAGEYTPDVTMVFNTSDLEKNREEKESALGFAKTTTEIRSMYLYDSAHNIFLLVSFAYIFFSSINHILSLKWIVLIALLLLVFLNQIPFAIGQSLLREYILKKYGSYASGVMESELKKDEFAPLMIKPEFFTSIFTIGAGGLLIALAENFIKELFK